MRRFNSVLTSLVLLISLNTLAHKKQVTPVLALQAGVSQMTAGKTSYTFQIHDTKTSKNLTPADLVEEHTKLLHLIVYDLALKEFRHLHPEYNGDQWATDLELSHNGDYFVWAQGMTKDQSEFSISTKLKVQGGSPAWPVVSLGDSRSAVDGMTSIKLANNKIRAGQPSMVNYQVTRTDNQAPLVTPYLGAQAHIIIVSPDGSTIIHAHPMENGSPAEGMIHATFPTPGGYRVWVQLNDHSELKTFALSVTVSK